MFMSECAAGTSAPHHSNWARTSLPIHLGNTKKCGPDFEIQTQTAIIYLVLY
jgi:hypothetical protein